MYRKNTASQFIHFQGVDATTGGIKSGVTWTIRRCIDGTFAAATGSTTEDGTAGWYKFAMSQADTNGNDIGFNFTGTGAIPQTVNIVTTACDPTTATNFGITGIPAVASGSAGALLIDGAGTAAISNSSGKVLLQTTQAGVTIPTVTTVTNQLTAAAVATGIWQDATGTDFTTASSIGKSLYTTGNAPGAASGLALVGSNVGAATSVSGSVGSVTGAVGSVTGAVGSVTGNVGGNVVGSVASVTGAVASVTAAVAVTSNIKKNQALSKFQFLMTDSTNHAPKTGLVVTCSRSIDGGAFATGTLANITEIANGTYTVDFGAGDLNGNVIVLQSTAAAADTTFDRIVTQP